MARMVGQDLPHLRSFLMGWKEVGCPQARMRHQTLQNRAHKHLHTELALRLIILEHFSDTVNSIIVMNVLVLHCILSLGCIVELDISEID